MNPMFCLSVQPFVMASQSQCIKGITIRENWWSECFINHCYCVRIYSIHNERQDINRFTRFRHVILHIISHNKSLLNVVPRCVWCLLRVSLNFRNIWEMVCVHVSFSVLNNDYFPDDSRILITCRTQVVPFSKLVLIIFVPVSLLENKKSTKTLFDVGTKNSSYLKQM